MSVNAPSIPGYRCGDPSSAPARFSSAGFEQPKAALVAGHDDLAMLLQATLWVPSSTRAGTW